MAAPNVPNSLVVTPSADSFDVSWAVPTGGDAVTGYQIYLDEDPYLDVGDTLGVAIPGLQPLTSYKVGVAAYNDDGYSPLVEWTTMTLAGPILTWSPADERYYHTGCDRGVLYTEEGAVPWNGITGVSESGAAGTSVLYRDGNIYYADVEPGDFEGTVNAFFWPDAFSRALGIPEIAPGLYADNQRPRKFGFTYRSLIGSGNSGDMFGYQIHLVYNAFASIGTRTRKTLTNSPEIQEFSFDLVAVPVRVRGFRPTAHFIIDTRNLAPGLVSQLEDLLYGNGEVMPHLPDPTDLYDLLNFGSAITFVDHGDGTWTGTGSSSNLIDNGDGTWVIRNVNGVDNGDGTYQLSDTP